MKKTLLLVLFLSCLFANAQEHFPINTGVKTTENTTVALTNAKIYVTPSKILKKGTLLIKDGKVIGTGTSLKIPKDAKIIDLNGKTIYPSFIDIYSTFGIAKPARATSTSSAPQYDANRKGYYWNDHIRPETNPIADFKFDAKKAKELLKAGFGAVNTHKHDGIVRGNGLFVTLNPTTSNAFRIIDERSAQYLSFRKSLKSRQIYPNSLMGSMALLRQVYHDADWYSQGHSKSKDLALEALLKNKDLLQIIEAGGKKNNVRADKVGDEFGIQYVIVGGGDEFESIEEIKNTNASYIIPINFRKAYDVSDPNMASKVALSDMRKWNQEPSNPSVLAKNGVNFSLTTHGLKSIGDFHKNLRKAIKHGLSKEAALQALTTIPATIIGKQNEVGSLQSGSLANFLITSGDVFDEKTVIYENWVQGSKNVVNSMNTIDLSGSYHVTFNGKELDLKISGKPASPKATVKHGTSTLKSKISYAEQWLYLSIANEDSPTEFTRLVAKVSKGFEAIEGTATDANGSVSTWKATKKTDEEKATSKKKKSDAVTVVPVTFPNMAYGFTEKPKQASLLFKNVTVWTSEAEGILENTDVLIKDGKIEKIGQNLNAGRATIIDGTGKHLTAGIIDEHSHLATESSNEVGHNSTAEVTMEDTVNPDDIRIYRTLAGGVTTLQTLHGSANPIGGRSALIKLKWGASADDMLYKGNDKFIKFALGENVKQSRSTNSPRFPQTRMGVEQLYVDYFQRAKEYDAVKKSGKPYRKDIEMEVLAEILNKERFITCHSYVQSEINMLMKVAEQFDFRLNTFTHILEGYKVADKMKAHGVGASTFSDWWAYKYEVNDAIPQNAAIMNNVGITVAINSDDAEMIRRLNQEAAKSIKYGGLSQEEAWKLITINPAKLLHIDDKVGSIKVGKDADVVLWDGPPMSIYSKPLRTVIEGVTYFDIETDAASRTAIKKERSTLINMMLHEKINGGAVQQPKKKATIELHCDTVLEY